MSRALRIVAADDEQFYRDLYRKIVPELGHELVEVYSSGRELVANAHQQHPDLILSDIMMDDLDGIEAAREICKQAPLPFVLVSSFHDPELIERAQVDCVMGYLIKPIRKADLETAIAIAMRRFEEFQILRMETEHYRQTLAHRKIIERAKGLLMKKTGLSEAAAFTRLQELAAKKNTKLVDLAQMILTASEVLT